MDSPLAGVVEIDDVDPEERQLFVALRAATLGDYDVYSPLGRGGMASVFLALDLALNRSVAIKVISPSTLTSGTLVERFWLEARTAASLSHPHVIPIFAVKSVAGLHFFVMKYVEGASLDSVLKSGGTLSISLVRTIVTQVSSALAYAHRRGVIHRDVKPANIMLDDEGFAVVMDFGIAKVRDVTALTTAGTMVGTPYYMSPEQFSEKEIDGRSDQYSLGVVAFELLTGRRPFTGDTVPQILRGHLLDPPPDIRGLRADCPPALAAAIGRMLSKAPEDRFPSFEAVTTLLGSMPTVDADDVREQLISLARTASMSRPRISQPVSPTPISSSYIPAAHAPKRSRNGAFGLLTSAAGFISRRRLMSSLVALAVVALAVSMLIRSRGATGEAVAQAAVASRGTRERQEPDAPLIGPAKPSVAVMNLRDDRPAKVSPTENSQSRARVKPDSAAPRQLETNSRSVVANSASKAANASAQQKVVDSKPATGLPSPVDSGPQRASAPGAGVAEPPVARPPAYTAATVRIGSRIRAAGLYIDGSFVDFIYGFPKMFQHAPGQIHLQIKADECLTWDTVLFVNPGDTAQIGYRQPGCTK